VSMILLGPGSSVTHDALRLLARHGTLLAAVGQDGVRSYTAPPLMPDRSDVARRQAELWGRRAGVSAWPVTCMRCAWVPCAGSKARESKPCTALMADKHGIEWKGRHYDHANPDAAVFPNQALNHAAIAVQSLAALPPLGFIYS
jgi:CRISPR-associated protein Cas1